MSQGTGAPLPESFWGRVEKTETCWLWTGATAGSGYGAFSFLGKRCYAHRLAYAAMKGDIPAGLQIDHLCRVHNCVNPDHLEAVSQRENLMRGDTFVARHAGRTHCRRGHPYDAENTYVNAGRRHCRKCIKAHRRVQYAKERGRPTPRTLEEALGQ